jgi:hypothetical protein
MDSRFSSLTDAELSAEVQLLEHKVRALWLATTACGRALLDTYLQALDAARAEQMATGEAATS